MEAKVVPPLDPRTWPTNAFGREVMSTTIPQEPLSAAMQYAIHRGIIALCTNRAIAPLYQSTLDIGTTPAVSDHIFRVIQSLNLSTPQNRRIAERITTLYRDAIAEHEHIRPESLTQCQDFFLRYPNLGLPKITLTPDGTIRARWIHGPGNFVAIEFIGELLVKLVAEIPKGDGVTAKWFGTESADDIVKAVHAIGTSFVSYDRP